MNRYAPVFALALLAPFIAEFLFGATPISRLGGFVFLVLLYGGGAVLIRELARRLSGTGWGRIAVLGAAYALIEEGLAVQSFFNPDLFQAGAIGGRALGVNWVWSEWTVGYHILWSLLIPILLTELLFPNHRTEPWLKRGGVAVAGVCFALGVVVIGIAFRRTIAPTFRGPAAHLAVTALTAAVLAVLALAWPIRPCARQLADARRSVPSPWVLGLLALVATAGWFGLFFLPDALKSGARALIPMVATAALAAGTGLLIRKWSAPDRRWTDLHRIALILGALPANMLFGFLVVTAGNRTDQIGQAVGCSVTLALLALFANRMRRRDSIMVAA
jgi:hypothetical protein